MGYHAVNILLHAANVVLVWRPFRRLGIPGAWVAAAVFAVHPIEVESVAWTSERKNVLSGFFALSAWLAFLRWEEVRQTTRSRLLWYGAGLACFVLALTSKTVTCTLPAVMLLVAAWRRRRLGWAELRPILPWLAIGLTVVPLTVVLEHRHLVNRQWDLDEPQRVLLAGRAIWFYLGKLLWPNPLIFMYPRWQLNPGQWWQWLWPLSALTLWPVFWFRRTRWGLAPLLAYSCFVVALSPALGFIDFYPMRYSFVADHFQYLAGLAVIALLTAWLTRWVRSASADVRPLVVGAGWGVLAVLAALTCRQTHAYANLETLWRDTLGKNPGCWMAHNNLAVLLDNQGRLQEAEEHTRAALAVEPTYQEAHNNLGGLLARQGRLEEATQEFVETFRADLTSTAAGKNLGVVLSQRGDLEQQVLALAESLRQRPGYERVADSLGRVLLLNSRLDAAARYFQQVIERHPNEPDPHYFRALALTRLNRNQEAITEYERCLALDPNRTSALVNLGAVLMLENRVDEAAIRYQQALKRDSGLLGARNNLAVALVQQGRLEEAVEQYEKILRIDPRFLPAHHNLADVLSKLGRTEEAQQHRSMDNIKDSPPSAHPPADSTTEF